MQIRDEIDAANKIAVSRILNSRPKLIGVEKAINALPGMSKKIFLHPGPPMDWQQMSGPLKGAAVGAMLYENLASNERQALRLLEDGEIQFESAHNHHCVCAMAGLISQSMPVFVVKDKIGNNYSFSTINEGVGRIRTLRYGAYGPGVIKGLEWIRDVLSPALVATIKVANGMELRPVISEALKRGDECHNRNKSATNIFFRNLAQNIVRTGLDKKTIAEIFGFVGGNDHFFLNLSMTASKIALDSAHGIKRSSIVTGMSSNGYKFGIRVSGLGPKTPPYSWYMFNPPFARGRYFTGYAKKDANKVLGDSYVSECVGLGGFAMAASPAITEFVGGNTKWALNIMTKMDRITLTRNNDFLIPYMNYRGTPTGIDIFKVKRSRILPILNSGIAHRTPGIGQIGAGIFHAPFQCFAKAVQDFNNNYGAR